MIDFFPSKPKQSVLQLNGMLINLIRSKKRKTLTLEVNHQGVKVRAPYKMSEQAIMKFILSKEQWLLKNLEDMPPPPKPIDFENNSEILLLGELYKIQIITGRKPIFIDQQNIVVIPISKTNLPLQSSIKNKLIRWYKNVAMQHLKLRVENRLIEMLSNNKKIPEIKVRDYKRRWGSCDHRGDLSFNWRIVMAPSKVMDYVVIHEIAHLKEFNHSRKFWRIVEQQMPDWKDQQQWLKNNGADLYRF